MLKALRGDEALDTRRFGIGLFAFAFGLDFAADDEFADLDCGEGEEVSGWGMDGGGGWRGK